MKKLMKIIMLLVIVATTMIFASCDSGDDNWYDNNQNTNNSSNDNTLNVLANTLRGHWEGKMLYEYTENGIRKQATFDGQMEFDQYDATSISGRGVEVDVSGTQSQELKFSWYIDSKTGDIYVTYDASKNQYVITFGNSNIQSYLDTKSFHGTMKGVNNDEYIDFDFSRYTYAKGYTPTFTRAAMTRAMGVVVENKIVKGRR
ncbi:hypothetical protein [Segatella paludivivens]|uniref:hypothetical protein n=2 Tax=Segatella paludivivens TaxID=185294 RepID=UPI000375D344|nr:hypothetical protein [Segatella paludivivens]